MKDKIFQVPIDQKISLHQDYDPAWLPSNLDKARAEAQLRAGIEQLAHLQDVLYAQNTYGILIIFQAMDAAGKDSTIKHVMSGVNPQGCQVYANF
jgi:polyphosphate kinase 2 (PPK2 family)